LPLHAGTGSALLQVASFIDDQDSTRITQVLCHVIPQVITHRPGIPPGASQQMLHPIRRQIPGMLCERPAVLPA
jgi:hypothetical protein